ncbi:monovalent cation/H(+) antiporter subunit G [Sphingomonas faeni]|uniref:monovalent cation/H(+) antiporter subunit G n=1 Tax=Sphingomonas faeni TaxID=185950 RepID=UPI00278A53C8|nr:monovalent cation/H(+) antiporter subunit G [Sphingomonas faeni]MDQ0839996.1 multicomponent K+:H+ antiporter subunit G [Sphingomonas faeni]
MIQAPDLPAWAALIVAILLLSGSTMTLVGSLGLIRLKTFYERVHAPTLGATVGVGSIVLASMVCFTALESRFVLHEILILAFLTLTTPVTLISLARAALYRDRTARDDEVPREHPMD